MWDRMGINNPNADHTVYTFKNRDGLTFTGNKYDFCQNYGIKKENLNELMRGKSKTTAGGWSLVK